MLLHRKHSLVIQFVFALSVGFIIIPIIQFMIGAIK